MAHLIDKSALVAVTEKCYNECLKKAKITNSDYWNAKADAYRNVLVILNDTLEVKEVDLEKEIQRQYNVHKNPDNSIVKDCVIMTKDGFEYFAKHFFELGLKAAQKGE